VTAIEGGVAAVRINPGNIGGPDKVALVVKAAKRVGIPMRIGANSGSLPKHLSGLAQKDQAEALVEAALEKTRLLEQLRFHDFKISVKSSHVPTMIRAYRRLSEKVPYPLHLGVTEAGTPFSGSVKSAVGMGALLVDGIGDTLRVSLTADPVEEVRVGFEILKSLGLRERGPLLRDRRLDRGRHEAPEAAEDGEAGGPRDGRSVAHPARRLTSRERSLCGHQRFSYRRCATTPPMRRPSATSCSSAAASSGRSA